MCLLIDYFCLDTDMEVARMAIGMLLLAGVVLALVLLLIDSVLLRLQHGEATRYDEPTIYVN